MILPVILPYLTHIINSSLHCCEFPELWKFAIVTPVPKRSKPTLADYRPISILPFLSKVFEKIIDKQIRDYLLANELFNNMQSGFRPKHSCCTAILKITEDIRLALNENKMSLLILLDMTKAFDSVNHNLLVLKLKYYFGFSSKASNLIASYLSNRYQQVRSGEKFSEFLSTSVGVPQGSILGPLLFAMFINDLTNVIQFCLYHLYADDLQIYISGKIDSILSMCLLINQDLRNIFNWTVENLLTLNAEKSQAIAIFRNELDTKNFPLIQLNGIVIPYCDTVKNLGIIFNKTLSWSNHANLVVSKVYGAIRRITLASSFLSQAVRLRLGQAIIFPIISYGFEIYGHLDKESLRKLTVAFNSIIRFVFSLRRFDHISKHVNSLLGCSLNSYRSFRIITLLYKILIGSVPLYLQTIVSFASSERSLALQVNRCNYSALENHFSAQAIKIWNALPINLRRQLGDKNFKNSIFDHFKNC